jgi:hypothetical protein
VRVQRGGEHAGRDQGGNPGRVHEHQPGRFLGESTALSSVAREFEDQAARISLG